jgi:hypothetical protein
MNADELAQTAEENHRLMQALGFDRMCEFERIFLRNDELARLQELFRPLTVYEFTAGLTEGFERDVRACVAEWDRLYVDAGQTETPEELPYGSDGIKRPIGFGRWPPGM